VSIEVIPVYIPGTGAGADADENVAAQLIADVTAEMLEESDPHELVDFTDRFKTTG
jgi:hypothetical protein